MSNPNLLTNRYRIIQQLGSGGFGDTFLAEDTHLPSSRTCVIKRLRPMNNNLQVYQIVKERFQREAAILEDLGNSHGQIPTLFAYFEEQGQFYLVQEYIQGETLSNLLKRQGKLREDAVQKILLELLEILEYLQGKRIIHRDIKPDNIIIRQSDQLPILIDFGAVRETMGTVVSSGGNSTNSIVIGTPGFMPPEQSIGRPVFSSDLYALGLTAIYLLTGRVPQELETNPLDGEILWRQYALNVSPALANVIDQSIKAQANQRFATAQLMRQALQGPSKMATTKPFLPAPQKQKVVTNKPVVTPKSNNQIFYLFKITFTAVIIAMTLLGGWAFFFRDQQEPQNIVSKPDQTEKSITEIESESQNNQDDKQNKIEQQEQDLKEKERQLQQAQQELAEKERQLEQFEKQTVEPNNNRPSSGQENLVWRSKSNLTRIANLNQICFGTTTISSVKTVFGYEKTPLTGTITIPSAQTAGCTNGDTLQGNFELSGNTGNCVGTIKITWQNNSNALIQWNIDNLGSACPASTRDWSINTYPVEF
ncbi:MAG: protein kinase [Symploca sp. SIO2E6]|nr:protein kinase [Symploca sp. SIO2E6]